MEGLEVGFEPLNYQDEAHVGTDFLYGFLWIIIAWTHDFEESARKRSKLFWSSNEQFQLSAVFDD